MWDEGVRCCAEGEEAGVVWACGEEILGKTQLIEVPGRQPPGRL